MRQTVIFMLFSHSLAFNLDIKHAQVFNGTGNNSHFGYDTALFYQRTDSDKFSYHLLVTEPAGFSQYYKINSGLLQTCNLNTNVCQEVPLLTNEDQMDLDNGWLGVSLDTDISAATNVVVCSHLRQDTSRLYHFLTGVCYVLDNTLSIVKELNPLKFSRATEFMGQAGFDSHFSLNNELALGAVGSIHWKGETVHYQSVDSDDYRAFLHVYGAHYDYLGYAITSGKFFRNPKVYYVVGAPRSDNVGKVFLYDSKDKVERFNYFVHFKGKQVGEFFGAAVCAVDLNADGLWDLVIGSPMFVSNIKEEGRVTVFINHDLGKWIPTFYINGDNNPGARFGTAISSIGDLNKDGYEDIAIGAPYQDNNRGAVYIYFGDKTGLRNHYVQRILASNISPMFQGFGISISKGVDIDSNTFPDIAIGSHLSGNAIVLRTCPLVTVTCNLFLNKYEIDPTIPYQVLNLDIKFSSQEDYDFDINYTLTLDAIMTINKRLSFSPNGSELVTTETFKINDAALSYLIYIEHGDDFNWLSPAIIHVKFDIIKKPTKEFCKNCPILDIDQLKTAETMITFSHHCKSQNCFSNLTLEWSSSRYPLVLFPETKDDFSINISILNTGDPAFNAKTTIVFNDTLFYYSGVKSLSKNVFISCKTEKVTNETLVKITCSHGNPLGSNTKASFWLSFKVIPLWLNTLATNITIEVTTSSYLFHPKIKTIPILLKQKADIFMTGYSQPSNIVVDEEDRSIITLEFNQSYEIRNLGPSTLENGIIYLLLPELIIDTINSSQGLQAKQIWVSNSDLNFDEENQPFPVDTLEKSTTCMIQNKEILFNEFKKRQNESKFLSNIISCEKFECIQYVCNLKKIIPDTKVTIKVLLGLNTNVLKPFKGSSNNINIATFVMLSNENQAHLDFTGVEYLVQAVTSVYPFTSTKRDHPTYITALSALGGLILLTIIAIILAKYGFFRRKDKEKLMLLKAEVYQADDTTTRY